MALLSKLRCPAGTRTVGNFLNKLSAKRPVGFITVKPPAKAVF